MQYFIVNYCKTILKRTIGNTNLFSRYEKQIDESER